jgi:hypothetical protein
MKSVRVHRIEKQRDRRGQRLEVARAMWAADPERAQLLDHLAEVIEVVGGSRAAIIRFDVIVGGFHPHLVLDLAADLPRRRFSCDPCLEAEERIGYSDWRKHRTTWVLLEADLLNVWYLVADGLAFGVNLPVEQAASLAFLAGRCSAVLLHSDLKGSDKGILVPEGGSERFEGWPVLKDIEGREGDDEINRRVSARFLVARALLALLGDELECDLDHQVRCVLKAIKDGGLRGDPERESWEEVLEAVRTCDGPSAARSTIALANKDTEAGSLWAAREFYRCAYLLAVKSGAQREALDSALGAASLADRRRRRKEARTWHEIARRLANVLATRKT